MLRNRRGIIINGTLPSVKIVLFERYFTKYNSLIGFKRKYFIEDIQTGLNVYMEELDTSMEYSKIKSLKVYVDNLNDEYRLYLECLMEYVDRRHIINEWI